MHLKPKNLYNRRFYEHFRAGNRSSAAAVLPIVLSLVRPKSAVDVGCGDGTWLSTLHELGVTDTVGVDGSYIDKRVLQIPPEHFRTVDLSKPFMLDRVFDLALSLEVAEHLPSDAAEAFVDSVIRLAPAVLFSAAIPFQGGVDHVNEQWPDYWAALFRQHDFLPIDYVRGQVWGNERVHTWYKQNILLFAKSARIYDDPVLRREYERTNQQQLRVVHPDKYLEVAPPPQYKVYEAARLLAGAVKRSARWRLRSLLGREKRV